VSGENPEGAEPQEGNGSQSALTGGRATTDRWSDQSLEVDAVGAGARGATLSQAMAGNGKRALAGDEPVGLASGKNPCRGNLGRGSRMKQAGKMWGGASRRERAKR
jgi:hypothetical protein